jgi:putative flippase GtrA
MALRARELYFRVRPMLPEIIKFCVVGGIGTVIDIGGAAVLHGRYHVEPLAAKAISTAAATAVTYLGSRYWTFKHRENQALRREALLFVALNLVGLLIAELVVGLVTYVFGLRSELDYNAASLIGTALATIFRYFAYKKWVFLAPAGPAGPAAADALPDYPPWEFDPAYLAAETTAHAAAPAHSSARDQRPASAEPPEAAAAWDQAAAPSPRGNEADGLTPAGSLEPRSPGRHRKG